MIEVADFLDTPLISLYLNRIIKNAKSELVLISPYLQINPLVKGLLEGKDREERDKLSVPSSGGVLAGVRNLVEPLLRPRVDIHVVFGKRNLKPKEREWFESLTSIKISFCKNLHAKCYLNEKWAIVTSMNLHQFSEQNNREMGILVSRQRDIELYKAIRKEAREIEAESEVVRKPVVVVQNDEDMESSDPAGDLTNSGVTKVGFCIRCKIDLPANPAKPYCEPHYRIWERYGNEDYKEKYCHTCGEEQISTMKKPVCPTCYRKYKNVLEFPAA